MTTRAERLAEADSNPTLGAATLGQRLAAVAKASFRSGIGMAEFELAWRRALICEALLANNFNQCRAANDLQLHRNTLNRVIKACRLEEWMRNQMSIRRHSRRNFR